MAESDYWAEGLFEAEINGVSFDASDRKVTGGRDHAPRLYSHSEGQDSEDTGRQPRRITFTIPLFRDVDEENYPNRYYALVDACENAEDRGFGELVDPEFGPIPVRILPYDWQQTSDQRNGGVFTLSCEEVGDESHVLAPTLEPSAGSIDRATSAAADLDESLVSAGVTEDALVEEWDAAGVPLTQDERDAGISNMSTLTGSYVDTTNQNISAEQASVIADTMLARVEVARDFATGARGDTRVREAILDSPGLSAPILASAAVLGGCVRAIVSRAFAGAPTVTETEVSSPTSMAELAAKHLGSAARMQEIIDLNPGLNPVRVKAGAKVRLPLER